MYMYLNVYTFTLWHLELSNCALDKVCTEQGSCLPYFDTYMYKHIELYPFPLFIYGILITLTIIRLFLLIEDRTLHSLQVRSDEASVLEFCWTVSIVIDRNL